MQVLFAAIFALSASLSSLARDTEMECVIAAHDPASEEKFSATYSFKIGADNAEISFIPSRDKKTNKKGVRIINDYAANSGRFEIKFHEITYSIATSVFRQTENDGPSRVFVLARTSIEYKHNENTFNIENGKCTLTVDESFDTNVIVDRKFFASISCKSKAYYGS